MSATSENRLCFDDQTDFVKFIEYDRKIKEAKDVELKRLHGRSIRAS